MTVPTTESNADSVSTRKIRPEAAILPGRRDPTMLILAWFARKSVYWVGGLAAVLAAVAHQREVSWGFDSPSAVVVLLGILLRIGAATAGLALAYPLTVDYEAELDERSGFGSTIGKWLDRRQLAKGFRALRWTHHIRQAALDQLGPTGDRLRHVERAIDVTNVVAIAAAVIASMFVAAG